MSRLLDAVLGILFLYLTPLWVWEFTDFTPVFWVVAAGELAVIVLAAVQPGRSAPGTRGAGGVGWRVALTVVAIAALNVVLNLIWPFKF